MLKTVVAATAAVTIAGTSIAYAQQREGRPDGARRWQPSIEDIRAFQAARLAALRAGLMMSAEQEKHWPAFEQAMREIQQMRLSRFTKMREARREGRRPDADPAERMRQRAARLSESGAVLKRLADATDPLYRSLGDSQKRRFAILSRSGRPHGMRPWRGRGGEPGMQRGQRRTDAAPADAQPRYERTVGRNDTDARTFGRNDTDRAIAGRVPGTWMVIEDALIFAGKTTLADPALFGGKVTIADGASSGPKALPIGRKVIPIAPSGFGRKVNDSI